VCVRVDIFRVVLVQTVGCQSPISGYRHHSCQQYTNISAYTCGATRWRREARNCDSRTAQRQPRTDTEVVSVGGGITDKQSHSHCLSHLLPPEMHHLGLRPRGHRYTLPICPNNLCKSSFILRSIFCFL